MSWFGKPTTKPTQTVNTNAVSELQRLRGRQISSLIRAGGQAINLQQSIFDVVVRLGDTRTLTLRVTLPDEFPMQAPVIQTTSRVQHSWLDSQCRVAGHIDLASWSAHADIGRIVGDVVNEFQRSPPVTMGRGVGASPPTMTYPPLGSSPAQIPAYQQPFYQSMQPPQQPNYPQSTYPPQPPSMASYNQPPAQYNTTTYQTEPPKREVSLTQAPAIPAIFPELEELSEAQLEKLVMDRATLKAYVKNMDSVVNFMKIYDDLVKGNYELAESNMKYESSITALQSEIHELKHEVHSAQEALDSKQFQQQQILSGFQPETLIACVSKAADDADDTSEEIASRFTNGEIDVTQFISEFIPIRKTYHLRSAKVDRFNNQE